jgi:DNA-binding response OmpR family regulator
MKQYRILIVDDEEDVRIFLTYNLEKEGLLVETAADGAEAIDRIISNDYDLVISDVMMPGMNGISMFKELKDQYRNEVPVIFLTASSDELHYISASLAGCYDYLAKPLALRVLKEKIQAALTEKVSSR